MRSKPIILLLLLIWPGWLFPQTGDSVQVYKKRVLENIEIDFLTSYYTQDGANAAVSGGTGDEDLTDITSTIVVSIPLNDNDVLTIDAGVSAYSSASSSNVDPFDNGTGDPFRASSGASRSDVWTSIAGSYTHSSNDRNDIWSVKLSFAVEYDYTSIGAGGSYAKLFNEKNTEISVGANVFIDTWSIMYPIELRPFDTGGNGLDDNFFNNHTITGNAIYQPAFTPLDSKGRNSYSLNLGLSQILNKNLQGSIALDLVKQTGLLSTPFQRVYFQDFADSFIDDFQLADDVERLPDNRFKIALGGRLHWFINERIVARTFYRYYVDDWGISSHTASVEVPVKLSPKFTVYPAYRYYQQTAADYFAPYEQHQSVNEFYTSDYDLSDYTANQFGFGVSYTDIFTEAHIFNFGLKSIDLKYYWYDRNTTFSSSLFTMGIKLVKD